MKGYVQVYTGNGKGKTTAAFGLAIRAAGAGLKVFIAQFVKGMHYSELKSFTYFKNKISIRQYGRQCFIFGKPEPEDFCAAKKGFDQVTKIIQSGEYPIVILDEITIAIYYNLLSVDSLLNLIKNRPKHVEIIITGRYADKKIMEAADLITEMREVKHYFNKGVKARIGIEK